jgi:hypothetical protein
VFQGSVEHLFSRNNILLISPFSLPFSLIVPLPLSSVKPICQWPDFPFLFTFLASLISIYLDLLNCLSRIPLLYLIVYLLIYLLFFFSINLGSLPLVLSLDQNRDIKTVILPC